MEGYWGLRMRVLGQGESRGRGPRESYPGPQLPPCPSCHTPQPQHSGLSLPIALALPGATLALLLPSPTATLLPSAHWSSPHIGHHWPHLPIPASLLDEVMLLLTFWSFLDCVCMVGPHLDYSALPLLRGPSIGPCDKHLLISMFSQMLPPPGSLP